MISRRPFAYSSMSSLASTEGVSLGASLSLLGSSAGTGRHQPALMRTALAQLKPEWGRRAGGRSERGHQLRWFLIAQVLDRGLHSEGAPTGRHGQIEDRHDPGHRHRQVKCVLMEQPTPSTPGWNTSVRSSGDASPRTPTRATGCKLVPAVVGSIEPPIGDHYPVTRATANSNDIKTTMAPVVKTKRSANNRRIEKLPKQSCSARNGTSTSAPSSRLAPFRSRPSSRSARR
jgi:hypothetical protein